MRRLAKGIICNGRSRKFAPTTIPRERPWFKAALAGNGKPVRTQAYEFAEDHAVIISTARAFIDADGGTGVISLDVSLNKLTEVAKKIRFGNNGYLLLVESDGNMLDQCIQQIISKPWQTWVMGTSFSLASRRVYNVQLDGKEYNASVYKSQTLGWTYIGLIESSEISAGAWHLVWVITLLGSVLVAIFGLCGVALSPQVLIADQQYLGGLARYRQRRCRSDAPPGGQG